MCEPLEEGRGSFDSALGTGTNMTEALARGLLPNLTRPETGAVLYDAHPQTPGSKARTTQTRQARGVISLPPVARLPPGKKPRASPAVPDHARRQ